MSNTFTYIGTIEDVYGNVHIDPVFLVQAYNYRQDNYMDGQYQRDTDTYNVSESGSKHVNYTIKYWTNQAAKDEGKFAMTFHDINDNPNFYFEGGTYETGEEVRLAAKTDFLDNRLPEHSV